MAWFADKLIAAVGGDYTTLAAFESAYDGEDISATDGVRARIKGTTSDADIIYFANWQAGQSVSCKIVITAETGYGLQDRVGWTGADGAGDDAIVPKELQIIEATNAIYIDVYSIELTNRIRWIAAAGGILRNWNCLIRDTGTSATYAATCGITTIYLANLLCRDLSASLAAIYSGDANVTLYAWHITHDYSGYGYYRDAGLIQLRNSIGVNVSAGAIGANVTDNDYCAADDTTPDNSGIDNIVEADNFTDIVGEDYTVKDTGADIYHAGTDQPAWFDTLTEGKDIRGVSWHATTPSMGCFEYEEAGGAYTLTAATGSFTLTGQSSALKADRKLPASAGSFTLTGQTTGLLAARKIPAEVGSFNLTGIDTILKATRKLAIDVGSFALTGVDANLLCGRKLIVSAGSFILTGIDINLVYNPSGTYTLTASPGSFTLTGIDVVLKTTRKLSVAAGSFSVSGIDAGLYCGRKIASAVGAYTFTGQSANFLTARKISATAGSFVLTGKAITLTYSGVAYKRYVLNSSPRHKYLLTSHAGHKYFLKSGPKARINLNSSPYWRR